MKNNQKHINLILLFFASIALFILIRYTDVVNIGIGKSLNEGFSNLKRIISAPSPNPDLSEAEKEKLKKTLSDSDSHPPLFCQSAYFPFIPGAKWRYQIINGTEKDVVELGVPRGEGNFIYLDGRRMSRDKWTVRTILACVDGRIKATDLNFLTVFERDGLVTTPCEKGGLNFSLPRDSDLIKGNSWSQNGCLIHTKLGKDYEEEESETKESLAVRFRALGSETVSVPAGEFQTEKLEIDFLGRGINFWIASGVGIVKISEKTTIQELIEYQIPTEKENKMQNK